MRQLHHASRSPRVRYPPKRLRASATIYLSTPPLYNPPLLPAASARQVLRASATLVEGQRNTWRAAPRVRYSGRQVPAESRCRMAAPRVRYSARQVPTRSRSRASATSYLFSPPPPSPLSYSPCRDKRIRGERLRASRTPRVSYLPREVREDVGWRLRASGAPRVKYLPDQDIR